MRKAAVILLTLICALAVAAKDKPDKQKGRDRGRDRGRADTHVQARVEYREFRPEHRTVIVDWYHAGHGLPPGLAKRGDLPPGLEKQLRRNGHLPPGLEKKMVAFPPVLIERLPPVPYGCERGFVGNIAVIWNPRTRVIFDFFIMN